MIIIIVCCVLLHTSSVIFFYAAIQPCVTYIYILVGSHACMRSERWHCLSDLSRREKGAHCTVNEIKWSISNERIRREPNETKKMKKPHFFPHTQCVLHTHTKRKFNEMFFLNCTIMQQPKMVKPSQANVWKCYGFIDRFGCWSLIAHIDLTNWHFWLFFFTNNWT